MILAGHRPMMLRRAGHAGTVTMLATVVLTLWPWAGAGSWAGVQPAATSPLRPQLALVDQTDWVAPGRPFALALAVTGPVPAGGLQVQVIPFAKLTSRSAFQQTLRNRVDTYPLGYPAPIPLSALAPDPAHRSAVTLPLTVVSPGHPAPPGSPSPDRPLVDLGPCGTDCGGVYPISVRLEDADSGEVVDELTTHLIFTDPVPGSLRLDFAWILPVAAPPSLTANGRSTIDAEESASLAALARAVTSGPDNIPLSLVPSPVSMEALASSPRPADRTTLAELASWAAAPGHQTVARTYAPVSLAALLDAGLGNQLGAQLERGEQVVQHTLHVQASPSTWVTNEALSPDALGRLQDQPVQHLVLPETDLIPVAEKYTLVHPFLLAGPQLDQTAAVASDPGLAAHLTDDTDPALAAHQLLADLATLYYDNPSDPQRGVVLATPPGWRTNATLLTTVLSALAHGPLVRPVTLDQLFAQVEPATTDAGGGATALVRHLAPGMGGMGGMAGGGPSALPTRALAATQSRLTAFFSTVGSTASPSTTTFLGMKDLLLVAASQDLGPSQRLQYLHDVEVAIDTQLDRLHIPPGQTITLTANRGQIPITIVSDAPYPVQAVLRVSSDKLGFPKGASLPVELSRRSNTKYFSVQARASGDFPLTVSLVSPEGHLVLLDSRFTIRSTATSTVAIVISVGAGAFLLGWWGRSLLKGRRTTRNRRLVPAEETG